MGPRSGARALPVAVALGGLLLTGCGPSEDAATGPLGDGTFVGTSAPDEQGAYAQVTVTIEDQDVIEVRFVTVQRDGSVKDSDYGTTVDGQVGHEEFYERAQQAVEAFEIYAARLAEVDDPDEVDVVSGATLSHAQFVEAAHAALAAAREAAEESGELTGEVTGGADEVTGGADEVTGGADEVTGGAAEVTGGAAGAAGPADTAGDGSA